MTRTHFFLCALAGTLAACSPGGDYPRSGYDDDDGAPYDDDDDGYDDDDATWNEEDDGSDEPPLDDDDDASDDDDTTDEEDESCEDSAEEPLTWYLSADDSNSQADATHLRHLIRNGQLYAQPLRVWEFLNYYSFAFEPAEPETVRIVPQMRSIDGGSSYSLLVGVVAPPMDVTTRPGLNLTFSVDTSGSMGAGGLTMAKASMLAVSSALREGDIVSMTAWASTNAVILDSHVVSGPDDATLAEAIDGLSAAGSTDLNGGLVAAYAVASANFSPERLNRVVLLSDGGANLGITDEELIAEHSDDAEEESIYMVGVGTPPANEYNDTLMDAVTDAGRGAYVYIDTTDEAAVVFGPERLEATLAIAARAVRLEMTLPPGFVMETFSGEQKSTDPDEVDPQHLGPNDAMLYHQTLIDCSPDGDSGGLEFGFVVTFEDPVTREPRSETVTMSVDEMLAAPTAQLTKAEAVLAYANAMQDVWGLTWEDRAGFLESVREEIAGVSEIAADPDIVEIVSLLDQAEAQS